MRKGDERNLNILIQLVKVDEEITARQALEMLVSYYELNKHSMMNIPHVNRIGHILKLSPNFMINGYYYGNDKRHVLYKRIN